MPIANTQLGKLRRNVLPNWSSICLTSLRTLLLLFAGFAIVLDVFAIIRLPSALGSNMVLQRQTTATLWGWCDPAEEITITVGWSPIAYKATGTNGARWSARIETPMAGGPYRIRIQGSSDLILENVMIGEVWLCSGQSNMEWSAALGLEQAIEEAPRAHHPNLRLFNVRKATSNFPQDDCDGSWQPCTPDSMRTFSALAYFFGRMLQTELNVPIGLIGSSWGGTPAEVWTPTEVFDRDSLLAAVAMSLQSFPWRPNAPASCYNAMIHPLVPFRLRGVIWYQGESNVADHASYQTLFTQMVSSWRHAWDGEFFPFYFVQIAPFRYPNRNVGALLREAQSRCESIPRSGMIVISDLVDSVRNIHPKDKKGAGRRLAALALAESYGKTEFSGRSPTYCRMSSEGNAIRLFFRHAEGGLVSKGGQPVGFQVAGADLQFHAAIAMIDGDTIVVANEHVLNPQAVRFAFDDETLPNVFSRKGLPLNLFRTDQWTVDTSKR